MWLPGKAASGKEKIYISFLKVESRRIQLFDLDGQNQETTSDGSHLKSLELVVTKCTPRPCESLLERVRGSQHLDLQLDPAPKCLPRERVGAQFHTVFHLPSQTPRPGAAFSQSNFDNSSAHKGHILVIHREMT